MPKKPFWRIIEKLQSIPKLTISHDLYTQKYRIKKVKQKKKRIRNKIKTFEYKDTI